MKEKDSSPALHSAAAETKGVLEYRNKRTVSRDSAGKITKIVNYLLNFNYVQN